MNNTELLLFIIEELKRQNNSIENLKDEELFFEILPGHDYKKMSSSWNNWLNKRVNGIKSKEAKSSIQKRYHFDSDVWKQGNIAQKDAIKKGIKKFFNQKDIDLSDIISEDEKMTPAQKDLLSKSLNLSIFYVDKEFEEDHVFLKYSSENQSFLIELFKQEYKKANYEFINRKVYPSLMSYNQNSHKIKILYAHTLGSLQVPKYEEAAKLLNGLKVEDDEVLIDIKTSAISNIKRDVLKKGVCSVETIQPIIDHYEEVFEKDESYHYYPAVNLAYLLIAVDEENDNTDKITEVYNKTKKSIETERDTEGYYAKISDIELKILSGHNNIQQELEMLLEEEAPSRDKVSRTTRQIQLFNNLNRHNESVRKGLNGAIKVLEDYKSSQNIHANTPNKP